jgi:hypothetical protein
MTLARRSSPGLFSDQTPVASRKGKGARRLRVRPAPYTERVEGPHVAYQCQLIKILRQGDSPGSLKAGLNPPLRALYGQFLVPGPIDRRCNDVACGLDNLGW